MVEELFEYKEVQIVDWMCLSYIDCELRKQIGFHKVGEVFPSISIDFTEGILQLYTTVGDDENYPETYSLSLQIQ